MRAFSQKLAGGSIIHARISIGAIALFAPARHTSRPHPQGIGCHDKQWRPTGEIRDGSRHYRPRKLLWNQAVK